MKLPYGEAPVGMLKLQKTHMENYQKLLSKVDFSRFCRVATSFWHRTSILEKEQEIISFKKPRY